jgi:hypothetical protein
MKREYREAESPIGKWHRFKTLLTWRRCDICGKEFRREVGFMGTGFCGPQFMSCAIYKTVYRCEQCHIGSREEER